MAEETPKTLNHFALVRFTDAYWALPPAERQPLLRGWLDRLRSAAEATHLYQVSGLEASADLLVWSAVRAEDPCAPARFFSGFAEANAPSRRHFSVHEALWGFTKPSSYTKTRSTQELDPFVPRRFPYLVMYPFVKTSEWYLKSREERQQMMMDHIKVGKQYPEITQLLLYSTGLQDQEFVVVYETEDLVRFLGLVTELRSTAARAFTLRDWPLHTAILQADDEALARWS